MVVVLVQARVLGYLETTDAEDSGTGTGSFFGIPGDEGVGRNYSLAPFTCYIIALLHCVRKIFRPIPFCLTITHTH